MQQNIGKIAKHVSSCLQLAVLLEVSAYKPGNVSRTANFQSTRYEHFLASAVAVEPSFAYAAERGVMVLNGKIQPHEVGIGTIIKNAVVDVDAWQHGGNTILGTILLLSPIAVAAGTTLAEKAKLSISKLRGNMKLFVQSTTPLDAVAVYDAINKANPGGLVGKAPTLDMNDPNSKKTILQKGMNLCDIFKISAPYDAISKEWVENYTVTFETGLPYFSQQLEEEGSLNTAIVNTFLKILSTVPDTLISRKASLDKAVEISERAREVLNLGGLTTPLGKKELSDFDNELRGTTNRYNPGATADIMAAILAISILNGYRP